MANVSAIYLENQIGLDYLIRNKCPNKLIQDVLNKPSIQLNYKNSDGDTALHLAVEACNEDIVDLLIRKGASIYIENKNGKTPMDIVEEKLQTNSNSDSNENNNTDWEMIKISLKKGEGESSRTNETQEVTSKRPNSSLDISSPSAKRPKIEHPAGGFRTSLHGIVFQLKLSRLFAQRAIKNNIGPFYMASELNAAEKFDDIVFEYGSQETRFLQAKHKLDCEKNKINMTHLLSTSNKEDFSLQKYFVSFCKINKNEDFKDSTLSDFIIITNTDFDFTSTKTRRQQQNELNNCEQIFKKIDDFNEKDILYINNSKTVKYEVKEIAKKNLKEMMIKSLIDSALKAKVIKGKDTIVKDILNSIKIIHSTSLINEAIQIAEKINEKNTNKHISSACDKFLQLQGIVFEFLDINYDDLKQAKKEIGQSKQKRTATLDELKLKVRAIALHIKEYGERDLEHAKGKCSNISDTRDMYFDVENDLKKIKEGILDTDDFEWIKRQCEESILKDYVPNTFYKDILKKTNSNLEELKIKMKEKMDDLISEISIIRVVLCIEDFDSLFAEFFEKFYFITNYPDEENLGKLLDAELNELFNLMESDLLGAALDRKMLEFLKYFKKGKAKFTTLEEMEVFFDRLKGEIKGLMATGLHIQHVKGLREYGIRFKNNPEKLQRFIDQNYDQSNEQSQMQVFHFCTITPRLSAIKVLHTIENSPQYKPSNSYIFTNLKTLLTGNEISSLRSQEPQDIILHAFRMEKTHCLLAIECHGEEDAKRVDLNRLYKELSEILQKNASKKLILIAKISSTFGSLKADSHQEDNILFQDLEQSSQAKILEKKVNFQGTDVQLNNLIDEKSADDVFDQVILSEFIEPEIEIKIGDKRAFLAFDYVKAFYIPRQFRLQDKKLSSQSVETIRNEEDFCNMDSLKQKIVIVANEAGMGKSTVLTSIAEKMKESLNSLWIVRINLNDYAERKNPQSLRKIQFKEANIDKAIDFVTKMVIKGPKKNTFIQFQQKLFEIGLKNKNSDHKPEPRKPKIVILFDAFDEISRKLKSETTTLLKALKMSQVAQIWISTRLHKKFHLEQELNSSAYTLRPLSEPNQVELAGNLWKWKLKYKETDSGKQFKLKTYKEICDYLNKIKFREEDCVKNLKEKISELQKTFTPKFRSKKKKLLTAIDDLDFAEYIKKLKDHWKPVEDKDIDFTANPLHLRMLTEVIYEKKFDLPENFGLFQLFDEFIKIKFFIYYKNKGKASDVETIEDVCNRDSDDLRKIHCTEAVKIFTDNHPLPNLKFVKDKAGFDKIGLLKLDEDEKNLEFNNRSYAEFFCSIYLVDNLEDNRVAKLAKDLMSEDDYKLLRQFFEENPNNKKRNEILLT